MMETLCVIRDIYRSIMEFEVKFHEKYNICFNEGMLLCSLKEEKHSAGELAQMLGLSNSNASKVIRSVEKKGLIERVLGDSDKRQMYFKLTDDGTEKIKSINCNTDDLPDKLKVLIQQHIQ